MKFGKLIDGRLHLCPMLGVDGQQRMHTNLPKYYETAQERDGWMEIVETEPPQGNYEMVYIVANGRIVQNWQAVEPEEEIEDIQTRIERMQSQIDYLAMMTDVEMEVVSNE